MSATKEINWTTSKDDAKLITKIAKRAVQTVEKHGGHYDYMEAEMDITACHANGNPLRLQALHDADDFNFLHDVCGIRQHLNRNTGKLMHCFSPRFSA